MKKFFVQNLNIRDFILIIIITIIGIILRFYGYTDQGYWMDEDFTFFLSKPNKSYIEILDVLEYEHKVVGNPNAPALFYYILNKFFYFFGYTPENGRLLTTFFNSISIPLCYFFCHIWTRNKLVSLYFCFFVALNLFLIWEAQETRPQSLVLFISILSLILFSINYLNDKNLLYIFLNFIVNLVLLTTHPVTFAIIFAQLFFLIYKFYFYKIKKKKLMLTVFFSIIIYILINFDYLFDQIAIPYEHFSKLSISFFYSYHFKSFFGSIYFGIFMLLLILILFIMNIKQNLNNDLLIFLSLIVIFAYASTIIISILKTGLMHPRYKIYCVPLILLWISVNLSFFKNFNFLFIIISFFNIINTTNYINDRHLKKPPTQEVLKIIVASQEKNVFTSFVVWKDRYDNTLKNYKQFKLNNLILIQNDSELINLNGFWLICANKMRSVQNSSENIPDVICDLKLKNFKQISFTKLDDYILTRFSKN